MPDSELQKLMKLYAVRGVRDWENTDDAVRRGVTSCLSGSGIVDNEHRVRSALEQSKHSNADASPQLFPMPDTYEKGQRKRSDRPRISLFAPRYPDGIQSHMAFDLLSFVSFKDDRRCLVFRFEPADAPRSSHGYPHVQLSRSLSRRTIPVGCVPSWLPDSYPALPVPARDSMDMFLSMAVAVHGFEGGMKRLLGEMFEERPRDVLKYVKKLENLLGIPRPTPESSTGTSDNSERNRP